MLGNFPRKKRPTKKTETRWDAVKINKVTQVFSHNFYQMAKTKYKDNETRNFNIIIRITK